MNRKRALEKLKALLDEKKDASKKETKVELWKRHKSLVRGKAVRIYEGENFMLKKSPTDSSHE